MFSLAALPSWLMSADWPGIETMIWSDPWIWTVAWVTPVPLTRSARMLRACCMLSLGGVAPFCSLAVNTTCVPPTRSMPSFGVCREPNPTIEYRIASRTARARK
jgi:hypothetical protein